MADVEPVPSSTHHSSATGRSIRHESHPKPLSVAYVSGECRDHALGRALLAVVARHDRRRIRSVVVSVGDEDPLEDSVREWSGRRVEDASWFVPHPLRDAMWPLSVTERFRRASDVYIRAPLDMYHVYLNYSAPPAAPATTVRLVEQTDNRGSSRTTNWELEIPGAVGTDPKDGNDVSRVVGAVVRSGADIAVDLAMHSGPGLRDVMQARPAPVSVAYLGFQAPMSACLSEGSRERRERDVKLDRRRHHVGP